MVFKNLNWSILRALILLSNTVQAEAPSIDVQEGRIHAGAETRSIVTLHPRFEHFLFNLRGCYIKVLQTPASSLEDHKDDHKYFAWNTNRVTLENVRIIDRPLGNYFRLGVGAYCPNDSHHLWLVTIYVSQINKYPPQFLKKIYSFKVSPTAKIGELVGKVKAEDQDTIIYNSKVHYRLVSYATYDRIALNEETGELRLMQNMNEIKTKNLNILIVEACDYGSPQKCASAEVEVVRVSLTSPLNVRVLAANPKYQITCWEAPQLGFPEVYFLRIINERVHATRPQYRMDVKSSNTPTECAITHKNADLGEKLSMLISANTTDDQSTSEPIPFVIAEEENCTGDCHGKGVPYCLNNTVTGKPEQASWNGEKYCICDMMYEEPSCKNIKKCKDETVAMPYGETSWNATPVGAKTGVVCPYGPIGQYINRYCLFDVNTRKAMWEPLPDENDCVTRKHLLQYLSTFTMVINGNNGSTSLKTAKLFTERLQHILSSALKDYDVANAMIRLADNLAASSPLQQVENSHLAIKLRTLVNNYAQEVVLPANETSKSLKSKNVHIMVMRISNASDIRQFGVARELELEIPDEVLNHAQKNKNWQNGSANASSAINQGAQIVLVRHKNHNFYPTVDLRVINSLPILEVFVKGVESDTSLASPISFTVNPEKYGAPVNYRDLGKNDYICVYWDEIGSKWSSRGVMTKKTISNGKLHIACETSHLTGFSILLDFQNKEPIDEKNEFLLNLLSWIGCTCSIIGLILTIVTYAIFRYLNREKAVKILLNLCTSMLLLNVIFVVSSAKPYFNYKPKICILIAMYLHYVTLSTLFWMGVEAVNMYQMLVQVFTTSEAYFMLKRCLIAWGVPMLIVGVTGGLRSDYYFHADDKYCRLSPLNTVAHYTAFVGPACLVLVFNCAVFVCLLRALSLSRDTNKPVGCNKSSKDQAAKSTSLTVQIRGALTVMVLLGITWVFGVFAVGPARLPFMYIFCVFNSSQGFVIFLVRCLLYEETRSAWLMLFRAGKLKRFKGKPRTITSHENSLSAGALARRNAGATVFTHCSVHRASGACACHYWPPAKKCATPRRPTSSSQMSSKTSLANKLSGKSDKVPALAPIKESQPLISIAGNTTDDNTRPAEQHSKNPTGIDYIDETPSSTPNMNVHRATD